MTNIIWKKIDGSVSVTHLTTETIENMRLADANAPQKLADLLAAKEPDKKAILEAERACKHFYNVRDNIGLTLEHHADILKTRGDISGDESCAGFRQSLPPDRDYRDAWTHDGIAVVHDMVKAKEIHKNKLRTLREPLLKQLDIDYQRADESSDTAGKSAIALKKKTLRDVTKHPDIDAAETIEQLKTAAIEFLK